MYAGGETSKTTTATVLGDGRVQLGSVGDRHRGGLELIITPVTDARGPGSSELELDSELERLRQRNASGSLSSHYDYDEMSTASSATSRRSTPTCPPSHHSPRCCLTAAALDFEGRHRQCPQTPLRVCCGSLQLRHNKPQHIEAMRFEQWASIRG